MQNKEAFLSSEQQVDSNNSNTFTGHCEIPVGFHQTGHLTSFVGLYLIQADHSFSFFWVLGLQGFAVLPGYTICWCWGHLFLILG